MKSYIHIKDIATNIYAYKAELMGLAIFWLMLFHSPRVGVISVIQDFGNIGVDIFCFLSGFTCSLSYLKGASKEGEGVLKTFYRKRIKRVLPPYFIFYLAWNAFFYIVQRYDVEGFLKNTFFYDVVVNNGTTLWYIPAITVMYLITPLYIKLCKSSKWIHCLPLLLFVIDICRSCLGIPIFFATLWVRLPIYLVGVSLFVLKDKDIVINRYTLYGLTITTIIVICVHTYRPELVNYKFCYVLFVPFVLTLVCLWQYKSKIWAFLGKISLENYLLHWLTVVTIQKYLPTTPIVVNIIIAVVVATIASYVYHVTLEKTVYRILK